MPVVPEKTLRELGWEKLLAALASRTRTSIGRERALALPLLESPEEVRVRMSLVDEARSLTRMELEIPAADTPDARPHLLRASRQGVLEPLAVLEVSRLIRSATRVRRFLVSRREQVPQLAQRASELHEFDPLAVEIERAIEPSGTVRDEASPLLAELRERARSLHRQLKERIETLLKDPAHDEHLQDKYYSVRDDRYVLPVKSSFKGKLPGVVHNASQSGQTLFVELDEFRDVGNQLTIVQSMAEEEERRILGELSDAIGRRAAELEADQESLADLDLLNASAKLSDALDASSPEVVGPERPYELHSLRHPLLVLRGVKVVPNDVALPEGRRGLVVSGPNAGGKTVTLTALGLVSLMARAGLPISAGAGSRVPAWRAVYTAIGDEGDLAKDLSTFTAHLTALKEIVKETVAGTLVLIDEMAADTDPREGAAIAAAVLEAIVDKGAQVLITTHLDELKAKALSDGRFISASVGFDFDALAPTYRLAMNQAGASSAIEIAQRVGLGDAICKRARELLGGSGGGLGRAIDALHKEKQEVQRLQRTLLDERQKVEASRERWEELAKAMQAKERESAGKARLEVVHELEKARAQARKILAELQQEKSVKAAVEAQKRLEQLEKQQQEKANRELAQAEAVKNDESLPTSGIKPGTRVRVPSVNRDGEVLELDGEEAVVAVGPLKARVKLSELVALKGRVKAPAKLKVTAEERMEKAAESAAKPLAEAPNRIDLRGRRADEALRELRSRLDALFTGDTKEAVVIHGHGTGVLKKAVREELGSSSYVASFRGGERPEGGDGVTIVTLKGR